MIKVPFVEDATPKSAAKLLTDSVIVIFLPSTAVMTISFPSDTMAVKSLMASIWAAIEVKVDPAVLVIVVVRVIVI